MRSFTDNNGRTWQVVINVAAVKRVRGVLGIDLFKLADEGFKGLAEVVGDPVQLVDVLFVLCQEQAKAVHVIDEQFGAAMGGDVLVAAAEAFVEELIDFFPERRARQALRQVIDKGRKVRDLVLDEAAQRIETLMPEKVALEIFRGWGSSDSSSSLPVSSASIPTPGP